MMKKRTLTKNTWHNCILKPIKEKDKTKDKTMSLYKANVTKDYSKPTHVKNMYSGGRKPKKVKI